jgi:hypothetical protein
MATDERALGRGRRLSFVALVLSVLLLLVIGVRLATSADDDDSNDAGPDPTSRTSTTSTSSSSVTTSTSSTSSTSVSIATELDGCAEGRLTVRIGGRPGPIEVRFEGPGIDGIRSYPGGDEPVVEIFTVAGPGSWRATVVRVDGRTTGASSSSVSCG